MLLILLGLLFPYIWTSFQLLRGHIGCHVFLMRDQDVRSPLLGRVKLNTNVTCFENGNRGVSFIIPNSQCQVLMSARKRITVLNSPSKGETLALIFGLQLVGEASFTVVDIESDNFQLICCL